MLLFFSCRTTESFCRVWNWTCQVGSLVQVYFKTWEVAVQWPCVVWLGRIKCPLKVNIIDGVCYHKCQLVPGRTAQQIMALKYGQWILKTKLLSICSLFTENVLAHPCIVFRRQCQVLCNLFDFLIDMLVHDTYLAHSSVEPMPRLLQKQVKRLQRRHWRSETISSC